MLHTGCLCKCVHVACRVPPVVQSCSGTSASKHFTAVLTAVLNARCMPWQTQWRHLGPARFGLLAHACLAELTSKHLMPVDYIKKVPVIVTLFVMPLATFGGCCADRNCERAHRQRKHRRHHLQTRGHAECPRCGARIRLHLLMCSQRCSPSCMDRHAGACAVSDAGKDRMAMQHEG